MNFTQPICEDCWTERNPHRQAMSLVNAGQEHCCYCNAPTDDGIYIRVDPRTVPHPTDPGI